jgi:hypothetical protein
MIANRDSTPAVAKVRPAPSTIDVDEGSAAAQEKTYGLPRKLPAGVLMEREY